MRPLARRHFHFDRDSHRFDHTKTNGRGDDDDAVYAAENGHVVARGGADGTRLWRADASFEFDSRAFVEQGRFFLTRGGTLAAFDDGGETSWERDVAPVRVQDVQVTNGTVVVRTHRSGLVALDVGTGDERWHIAAGSDVRGPTVDTDRLFVATAEGSVYGVSLD